METEKRLNKLEKLVTRLMRKTPTKMPVLNLRVPIVSEIYSVEPDGVIAQILIPFHGVIDELFVAGIFEDREASITMQKVHGEERIDHRFCLTKPLTKFHLGLEVSAGDILVFLPEEGQLTEAGVSLMCTVKRNASEILFALTEQLEACDEGV